MRLFWVKSSLVTISALTVAVAAAVLFTPKSKGAEGDMIAPALSDIKIEKTTATTTIITWKTDEPADSMINYGLNKDYGIKRDPYLTPTSHRIVIDNLLPGTTYYFRVMSADAAGNQSISSDYVFTTTGVKIIREEKATPTPRPQPQQNQQPGGIQTTLTEEVIRLLEQLKDPEALLKIQDKLQELADSVLRPPALVGSPDVETGPDWAIITWNTDIDANSMAYFAAEGEYNPTRPNPYVYQQGNPYEYVTKHQIKIIGLVPYTKYHFRLSSKPQLGPEGLSEDKTFMTKAILPEVRSVTVKKVEENAATLAWITNVPTSAIVEYTDSNTKETRMMGSPLYVTNHTQRITELKFKTTYIAVIKAESEAGDKAESRPIAFTTGKDEMPPVITRVNNESTLYPGADMKVQTIVSWETDEPSDCQFFYHEGLVNNKDKFSFPAEANPVLKHVQVITTFTPATIYKFWLECMDVTGNKARSEDFVLFTPQKEKSIIDIILENFQGTFGWVKNIGAGGAKTN